MADADNTKNIAMDESDPTKKDEAPTDEKRSLKESVTAFVNAEGKPIQWLLDRCNGHERLMNPNQRPCCFLLYPNGFLKLCPGMT